MEPLWEFENGFIRIANVYFGKNGRKFGSTEGVEPFDGDFFVDDEVGESIKVYGDWVILEKARRAYHKNGTVAIFEYTMPDVKKLDGVDTRWPRALVSDVYIEYIFYARPVDGENADFEFDIAPCEGCIRVHATNPEKALKNAVLFHRLTGEWPVGAGDDYASSEKVTCKEDEVVLYHPYKNIRLSTAAVKPGEIKINEGQREEKLSGAVKIHYFAGVPYEAVFNSGGVRIIIERRFDETSEDFIRRARRLAKIRVVEGRAPYRAETDAMNYTAWIKLDGEVVEVNLPYGYMLEGVEYVRGKATTPRQPLKKYFDAGTVVRTFFISKPLIKRGGEYYLGDARIGPAKDPHDALKKYWEARRKERKEDKDGRPSVRDNSKKIPAIRIVWEVNPEYTDEVYYEYSEENARKIREIIKRLDYEYGEVLVRAKGKYPVGGLEVPRFVAEEGRKIIEEVEELVPLFVGGISPLHEDVGTYDVNVEEDVEVALRKLMPRVRSFRSRFEEEVKKAGIREVVFEARESFNLEKYRWL